MLFITDLKNVNCLDYLLQVEKCKMPGLAVALTLEMYNDSLMSDPPGEEGGSDTDVVGFVSGMLLGNDIGVKEWFSHYVKIGQKVNTSTCTGVMSLLTTLTVSLCYVIIEYRIRIEMLCHQWVHFLLYSFCFVLFIYSSLFCWIPLWSIVLYSVLFYSVLCHYILFYSVLFYSTLLYVCFSWSESGQWSSYTDYAIACSILYSIPFYFLDFSWSVSRRWPSYIGCVNACWSRWSWC